MRCQVKLPSAAITGSTSRSQGQLVVRDGEGARIFRRSPGERGGPIVRDPRHKRPSLRRCRWSHRDRHSSPTQHLPRRPRRYRWSLRIPEQRCPGRQPRTRCTLRRIRHYPRGRGVVRPAPSTAAQTRQRTKGRVASIGAHHGVGVLAISPVEVRRAVVSTATATTATAVDATTATTSNDQDAHRGDPRGDSPVAGAHRGERDDDVSAG